MFLSLYVSTSGFGFVSGIIFVSGGNEAIFFGMFGLVWGFLFLVFPDLIVTMGQIFPSHFSFPVNLGFCFEYK